jgi:hypothetical protein
MALEAIAPEDEPGGKIQKQNNALCKPVNTF